MTKGLFVILLLIPVWTLANMASPIEEGSLGASPYTSRQVDVLREFIRITPDRQFATARLEIEYHIRSDRAGVQIPLLFYAVDYADDFKVWVDDRPVEILPIPDAYGALGGTPFSEFEHIFQPSEWSSSLETDLYTSTTNTLKVTTDELQYFKVNLTRNTHVIRVSYTARRWEDRSDWVKEYSFRYALSPARYWRSFGELEVVLDMRNSPGTTVLTSLGPPSEGWLDTVATWRFDGIPNPMLQVDRTPGINATARALLSLTPEGMTAIFCVLLFIFHLWGMIVYRNKYPDPRFSWPMILGSLLVPALGLASYSFSVNLILDAIGPHSGGQFGYLIIVLFFYYPLVLPLYWLLMWLIDRQLVKSRRIL